VSRRNTLLFFIIVLLRRTHSGAVTFVTLYLVPATQGPT